MLNVGTKQTVCARAFASSIILRARVEHYRNCLLSRGGRLRCIRFVNYIVLMRENAIVCMMAGIVGHLGEREVACACVNRPAIIVRSSSQMRWQDP